MKVLHITNEFTKKNFSISSLIVFITTNLNIDKNYLYSVLTSKLEEGLFRNKNINVLNYDKWIYFFKQNSLKKVILENDIIHIHGLWAPIQLISLLICSKRKLNCIVHPHGMLLDPALKSAGYFKFVLKKISLIYLNIILKTNVEFISITNQEKNAIEKYFPNHKVTLIPNPIPFKYTENLEKKKDKLIVYFGRIHPHKNIDLLISSFLKAKLSEDWKLEIYGIRDDEKYYNKILNQIKNSKQIEIKKPVFDHEKSNIMKRAWLNVLVSKSEVLSLSILESSVNGLPSLVNKDIETIDKENKSLLTNLNEKEISEKIKNITTWTLDKRLNSGLDSFKKTIENISLKKIFEKYINLYNEFTKVDIINNQISREKYYQNKIVDQTSKVDFLFTSGTYMFNLMFSSIIVVLLVFLGQYSVAGEIGLITSFWITITQIFSSNMRSIIVSEENKVYAQMTILYRLIFSIITLLLFFTLQPYIINFENITLIKMISVLIMVQWINEMNLVQYEIRNKFSIFKFITYANLIAIILIGISLILLRIDLLEIIIPGYIFFILAFLVKNIFKVLTNFRNFDIYKIVELNIKTIAFISSFSIIISSFAWRIMIYFIFSKSLAGIFFACFSLGSFPGTLFNSVVGPAFIKQKINISKSFKFLSYFFFLVLILIFLYSISNVKDPINSSLINYHFISFTISISLMGSYFMSYAMYLRHRKIQSSIEERNYLFKRDILYGTSITFIIPILFNLGGTVFVSFSFFIASLIALFSYSISISNKKINFKF